MNTKIVSFIERNKPIFIIGIILTLVFSIIVIAYRLRPGRETELRELNESETLKYKVREYDNQESYGDGDEAEKDQESTEQGSVEEEPHIDIDEVFGIVKISYTKEKGFTPMIIRVYQGQRIVWTNDTKETIYLKQRKPTYSELLNEIEINPGASFEFQMTELGIWTYKERYSNHEGSIDVKRVPDTLPEPEEDTVLDLEEELEMEPEQEMPGTEPATQDIIPVEQESLAN